MLSKLSILRILFFFVSCFFLQSTVAQSTDDACATWERMSNTEVNINKAIKVSKAYLGKVDENCKIDIYKNIANFYWRALKIDSSMLYIDKAIHIAISEKNDDGLADCYGYKSFLLTKKNKFDEAKVYLEKTRALLEKYPNSLHWVGHYYHLENYYSGQNKSDMAFKYSDSALQAGIRLKDSANIANLYQNLGVKYHNNGNYELALENLLKSLEIKESKNAPQLEGSYYTVGVCLYKLGDYNLAEEYIQKAIETSKNTGNDNVRLLSNLMLGQQKRLEKDNVKALEYINDGIVLAKKLNSNSQTSQILLEKGNIYNHGFDSLQKAEKIYLEAYDYAKKGNNPIATWSALLEMYAIYLSQGKYDKSKKYLDLIEKEEKVSNNLNKTKDWHFTAGQYYKTSKRDDKKALYHYLEYYTIKDSLEGIQVKDNLANLEKKYETNKNELKIVKLSEEKALQEVETKKAETKQYIFLGISIVALLTLITGLMIFLKIKKQQRALQKAHREVTALNKVKDHLFSILAHDLRGMILPFQRAGKILTYHIDKGNFEKTITLSKELERNSQSLSDVLNNLLNWSLEQMNSYEMNLIKLSVTEELEEIVAGFKQHSTYKNTEVHLECDTEDILFDKGAFHLIFRNLIGNALKYTENGIIKITAINRDNDVTFTVTDTGVGIAPDKVSKIFSLEKEQSTTGTKGEKGTGLGLNLVKRFVQLHKGKIDVKSREPNGTEFRLIFPNSSPK